MAEDPTVETPEVEQPQETPKEDWSQERIDSFITQLEAANVSTPQELQGKLEASRQAGQTANLLGEARNELKALREELAATRAQPVPPKTEFDEFDTGNTAVDLEQTISKVYRRERELEQKQMAEHQAKTNAQWNAIVSDPNYANVKTVWEEKLKDPNFVYQINSGLVNPTQAYNNTVIEFYKGMSQKAVDLVKTLQGKKSTVSPPHVESSTETPDPEEPMTDQYAKIKKLQEKALKGQQPTEEDEYAALDALLPPGFME
jgi:hypothetical protein